MRKCFFSVGVVAALLLVSVINGYGRGKETQEEIVTAYVAALNSKDEAALRALYHPNSDFSLTPLQRRFFDEAFTRELEKAVPEGYSYELTELERGVLPLYSVVDWSSNPLVQMTVKYTEDSGREVYLIRFLSKAGQRWFIAFPMPNSKMLGGYETYLKDKAEGRIEPAPDAAAPSGTGSDSSSGADSAASGTGSASSAGTGAAVAPSATDSASFSPTGAGSSPTGAAPSAAGVSPSQR